MSQEAIPPEVIRWMVEAREVASRAHAPYSRFHVGAVLVDESGQTFHGCNVENASFGLTLCAERVAATRAVAEGSRKWKTLVIVSPTVVAPCGACRQFLIEFASTLDIWLGGLDDAMPIRRAKLEELLPDAISIEDVHREGERPAS